jgi:hypothetical protein
MSICEFTNNVQLQGRQEKSPHLDRFTRLRLSSMARNGVTARQYMPAILNLITAEAQYSALMYFHRRAGNIEHVPNRILTLQDRVTIFNMRQNGVKVPDIAKRIKSSKSNVSRVLLKMGFEGRSHVPLTRDEICLIRQMRLSGASLRDITEKMGRTHSTIKYQVDRMHC